MKARTKSSIGFLYPPWKEPIWFKEVDVWVIPDNFAILNEIEPLVTFKVAVGSKPKRFSRKANRPGCLASINTCAPVWPVSST